MRKKRYVLIKVTLLGKIDFNDNISTDNIDGFRFKPRNKVKYDGVTVHAVTVIKPSFVEKLLRRKIKNKLDVYLQCIINIIDNDEDDPNNETTIRIALNDITRYKSILKTKYYDYLDELYYKLLMRKIDLLEEELQKKKYIYEHKRLLEEEVKTRTGKSR